MVSLECILASPICRNIGLGFKCPPSFTVSSTPARFLSLCLSRDFCEQVMLFKPEVRPGRQPAPKVDPLFGHGDPDALATPAADEQQKPMSPKEKKESARKKKEQVGSARRAICFDPIMNAHTRFVCGDCIPHELSSDASFGCLF